MEADLCGGLALERPLYFRPALSCEQCVNNDHVEHDEGCGVSQSAYHMPDSSTWPAVHPKTEVNQARLFLMSGLTTVAYSSFAALTQQ
jgi:hypothetical protein